MSEGPLENRTAIVIGGARGIGGSISATLARDGARVGCIYHGGAEAALALRTRVAEAGGALVMAQADVRNAAALSACVQEFTATLGPVDVLVYNAGISRAMPVLGGDLRAMRDVFEVNYWPAVVAIQAVLPDMLSRRFGRVIFISSALADRGSVQGQAAYASSKAALNALTRVLAGEISSRGDLTVNAVAPGPVRTALTAAAFDAAGDTVLAHTPAGRYGDPTEVAEVVAFLASDRASYVTGQVMYVDGGFGNKFFSFRKRRHAAP